MILPWHTALFDTWRQLAQHAHAYLVVAPQDTGGEQLLHSMAASVLCETPAAPQACGTCASCQLIRAHSHPDFRVVRPSIWDVQHEIEELRPEKPSKEISIAQIRELANMVNQTSHRGGQRVIVLYPAHKLNANAANALLKTLEEPPANTLFLLLAHDVRQILPTIVSRCQRLTAPAPTLEAASAYLTQQHGANPNWATYLSTENNAVMRVAQLHDTNYFTLQNQLADELARGKQLNALKIAETFDKHIKDADKARLAGQAHSVDLFAVITWLQRWTHDLASAAQTQQPPRYYPQHHKAIHQLAAHADPLKLHAWQQQLATEKRSSDHPLTLKTWLEKLLMQYSQMI
ncbi:MAG: DNA polymerase III subunit delta' [Formosimonas sp.]